MLFRKFTLSVLAASAALQITAVKAEQDITSLIAAHIEEYEPPKTLSGARLSGSSASLSEENRNKLLAELALERLEQSFELSPETTDLIGDEVDLSSGGLSLSQTDVAIPGNFPIDVAVTRVYKGRQYSADNALSFADWQLALPAISTTLLNLPDDSFTGAWGQGKACSGDVNPGVSFTEDRSISVTANQYWSGDFINIPGRGSERILQKPNSTIKFAKNWKLSCINSGGIEGYKATSSDGLTYTFDKLVLIHTTPVEVFWREMNVNTEVPRMNALLQASKVEDRFGNWVEYHYSAPGKLAYITSSDQRRIEFTYKAGTNRPLIESVKAGGKTWLYEYRVAYDARNVAHDQLQKVVLPDGRTWQLDLQLDRFTELKAKRMLYGPNDSIVGENQCISASTLSHTAKITHPNGVIAQFDMSPKRFGRSRVPVQLANPSKANNYDRCFVNFAIVKKRLSGPGLEPMEWTYSYSENPGTYSTTNQYDKGPAGQPLPTLPASISGYNLLDLKSTTVLAPDGSKTLHVFDRSFTVNENQKVAEIYFDTNGNTVQQAQQFKYAPMALPAEPRLIYCPEISGGLCRGPVYENEAPHKHFVNRISAVVTTYVNGSAADTYTTLFEQYNSYGQYTRKVESNSFNTEKRYTRLSFIHDVNNWLLNLPTKVELSSNNASWSTVSETNYYAHNHANKSLPKDQFEFGVLQRTNASYHTDGNLKLLKLNLTDRWAQYENYKRGKPQLIKVPKRYQSGCSNPDSCFVSASQVVNDDGTVSEVKNFNNVVTRYHYDSMRRLKTIQPADTRWAATNISYGFDAGYFTQTITTGNYVKTNRFDGLTRPILITKWDKSDASSKSHITQRFNAYNKAVFTSFPSTNDTEQDGQVVEYDGLQRVMRQYNTVSMAGTEYEYLSNNQIKTTDANGNVTYTSYRALGTPAQELASTIASPEGVTTEIGYNLFDNITAVTQGGITESRVYNAQQRLCRLVRPDVGHTVYSYNALGQPVWTAQGAAGSASGCNESAVLANQKVSLSYDNLGAIRTQSFPDSTQNNVVTLDNQGNLTRLASGAVIWDYSYNTKQLLETEKLSLDSKIFNIQYAYNALGHQSSLTYPGGLTVLLNPNALGQTKQVGSYASAISYYAGGQLKSFKFGNSITRSFTLDAQQRPEKINDYYGTSQFIDFSYSYDNNSNITHITDRLAPAYNLTLGYDGLDRLESAAGQWGAGSFSYDELGNIKQQKLGSSTLNYSYQNNRLTALSGSQSRSLSYDARGNITHNGLRSLSYNLANQLVSSGNLSYRYDGHNRLVKRSSPSGNSYHVYSQGGKLLHELATDNSSTHYIYLGNQLIAKINGSTASYVHTDLLGSPRLETTASRALQSNSRQHYQPFGQRIPSSNYTDIGFTGHKHDGELGLTYMQARYYDPVIGRFYSNDPVGWTASNPVMSFNRYLYVNNNPYKYTDPNGEYLESVWDAASLSVGLTSLGSNLANGNWAAAGLDALGVIADGAALALPVVPGGASMAISASRKGADFIATADGAVVHNSTSGVRNSLEEAGMSGTTVTNKAGTESGTIHNVPEMKMDVRVMDGGPNHPPRVVTSREGSSQAVNPANGSNFGNVPKTEQRARSHIELEK